MVFRVLQSGFPGTYIQDAPNPITNGLDRAASTLLELGPRLAQIDLEKRRVANAERMQGEQIATMQQERAKDAENQQLKRVEQAPGNFRATPSPYLNDVANRLEQKQANEGIAPSDYNAEPPVAPVEEWIKNPYAAATTDRRSPAAQGYSRYVRGQEAKIRGVEAGIDSRNSLVDSRNKLADAAMIKARAAEDRTAAMAAKDPRYMPMYRKVAQESRIRKSDEDLARESGYDPINPDDMAQFKTARQFGMLKFSPSELYNDGDPDAIHEETMRRLTMPQTYEPTPPGQVTVTQDPPPTQGPPAPTQGPPKGIVRRAALEQTVQQGHYRTVEEAEADARAQGYEVQ